MALAARELGSDRFGSYASMNVVYLFVSGLLNAYFQQEMVLSGETRQERDSRTLLNIRATAACGAIGSVVVLAAVGLAHGMSLSWLAFAISLVPLLIREVFRTWCSYIKKPGYAMWADAMWSALLVCGFVILKSTQSTSVTSMLLVWSGAGVASGLLMAVPFWAGRRDLVSLKLGVFLGRRYLGWRFMMEFLLSRGSSQLLTLSFGLLASSSMVGGIRGSQTLLGPVGAVLTAVSTFAIPVVRDLPEKSMRRAWGISSVVLVILSLLVSVLLLWLPPSWGEAVLGSSWFQIRMVLVYFCVEQLFLAWSTGTSVFLRIVSARSTLRVRWLSSGVLVFFVLYAVILREANVALLAYPFSAGAYAVGAAFILLSSLSSSGRAGVHDVRA